MPHLPYLIQAREQRGWTQQELADQLGVTRVTISRWEQGEMHPRATMRRHLAALLEQSEEILFSARLLDHEPAPSTQEQVPEVLDPLLPTRPHSLVGRSTELAQVKATLLRGRDVALTALNGLPGVGKTTLAAALVHDREIRRSFSDGMLWAGLGPHPNVTSLLSHWGAILGVPRMESATLEDLARALRAAIGHQRMLLVIDDAWTLVDALAFKIGGPCCAYILTTRFADIVQLFSPDGAYALNELDEEQSMELLKELAPEVVTREEQKTRDLIRAVGGLPLALTLIGNYLRRQGHADQSRRLAMAYDRLRHPEARLHLSELRAPLEQSTTLTTSLISLQEIIAASDRYLPAQARQALYVLSVFPAKPHSFSEEAALAVAACDYETIDTLVDAGLMTALGERLTLHQTIADYARQQLQADRHLEKEAQLRLVAWMRQFLHAQQQDLHGLAAELPLVLTALDVAVTHTLPELVEVLLVVAPYFLRTGLYHQLAQYARSALLLAQDEEAWRLKLVLGRALKALGQFTEAHAMFAQGVQALQQAQQMGPLLVEYYAMLGKILEKMGQYQDAERFLRAGLALAQEQGIMNETTCRLLLYLGSTLDLQGRCQQAYTYHQEGLALAQQQHNDELMIHFQVNLGANIATTTWDLMLADHHFQQALEVAKRLHHQEVQCIIAINLAETQRQRGTPQALRKAEQYVQEGLAIAESTGLQEWLAVLLLTSAAVKIKQRRYHAAAQALDRCLVLVDQLNMQNRLRTQVYEHRGELALALQHLEEAEVWFARAWEICPVEDIETLAMILFGYARLYEARGERTLARAWAQQSTRYYSRLGPGLVVPVEQWLAAHPAGGDEDEAPVVAVGRSDDV